MKKNDRTDGKKRRLSCAFLFLFGEFTGNRQNLSESLPKDNQRQGIFYVLRNAILEN